MRDLQQPSAPAGLEEVSAGASAMSQVQPMDVATPQLRCAIDGPSSTTTASARALVVPSSSSSSSATAAATAETGDTTLDASVAKFLQTFSEEFAKLVQEAAQWFDHGLGVALVMQIVRELQSQVAPRRNQKDLQLARQVVREVIEALHDAAQSFLTKRYSERVGPEEAAFKTLLETIKVSAGEGKNRERRKLVCSTFFFF